MTLNETDDTDPEQPQALPAIDERPGRDRDEAGRLATRYAMLDGPDLLRPLIEREFFGRPAVVSSFGAESAALLAMVADIDRDTPVLLLDTGKLLGKTPRYRDLLVDRLGLSDVRTITPDVAKLSSAEGAPCGGASRSGAG